MIFSGRPIYTEKGIEMANLQVLEYSVGDIGTNCYLIVNQDTKETIIVDPGGDAPKIQNEIKSRGLKPVAIFLTHAHYDHAHDVKPLKAAYGIPVYAHEAERETLSDPRVNVSYMFGSPESYEADIFVKDGEEIDVAGFRFKVLFTPGHTAGGCCYYLPEDNVLFCGDTLFCGSIGRTDFPGGSMSQLVRVIREKLLTHPAETIVYPCHMDKTTIGQEAKYNPFL